MLVNFSMYNRTLGMIFELCEGGQLNKLLHNPDNSPTRRFNTGRKMAMAKDVAIGLEYIHSMRSLCVCVCVCGFYVNFCTWSHVSKTHANCTVREAAEGFSLTSPRATWLTSGRGDTLVFQNSKEGTSDLKNHFGRNIRWNCAAAFSLQVPESAQN